MAQPPSFPFYPADWLLGTLTFSLAEDGAYLRLVMHQWNAGSVPGDDLAAIAKILRVSEREARPVWAAVSAKFIRGDDGGWRNARVEKQRAEKVRYHEGQAAKGRRSAEQRLNRGSTAVVTTVTTAVDSRLQPEGQPEPNLSLALVSEPTAQRDARPNDARPKRASHGDHFGQRLDPSAAAHAIVSEKQLIAIPGTWWERARKDRGLDFDDVDVFARWLAAEVRAGLTVGANKLAWLDAELARWLVARRSTATSDALERQTEAWRAEQAAHRATRATPEEIREGLRAGRALR